MKKIFLISAALLTALILLSCASTGGGGSTAARYGGAGNPIPGFPDFVQAENLGLYGDDGYHPITWAFCPTGWAHDHYHYNQDILRTGKHYIIASRGGGTADGFSEIKFALQGDGPTNWVPVIMATESFTDFPHASDEIVYFVLSIPAFALNYADQAKFFVDSNWQALGTFGAYITMSDLSAMPDDAVPLVKRDLDSDDEEGIVFGYITKNINLR